MMPDVLKSIRFGEISYNPQDIVGFEEGIPGFEGLKRFLLIESQDFAPMRFFQSVDDPNISFPLLPPQTVSSGYQLEIPSKQRRQLGLHSPEEAAVLCVVTIDEDPNCSTINLFAPVVINPAQRKACQIMQFGSQYPVDAPLLTEKG